MAIIPNKTKFRLRFRNKVQIRRILNRNSRLRQLLKMYLQLKKKNKHLWFIQGQKRTDSAELNRNVYKTLYYKIYNNLKNSILETKIDSSYISKEYAKDNCLKIPLKKTFLGPLQPLKHSSIDFCSPENTECTMTVKNSERLKLSFKLRSNNLLSKKKEKKLISGIKLLFGNYGISFEQYGLLNSKCVETAKLDIAKSLRKKGRVWIRICCDGPVTARPAETRMGKGKGPISHWVAKVYPGQIFFEFSGVTKTKFKVIYDKLCKKLAVNLKMVY